MNKSTSIFWYVWLGTGCGCSDSACWLDLYLRKIEQPFTILSISQLILLGQYNNFLYTPQCLNVPYGFSAAFLCGDYQYHYFDPFKGHSINHCEFMFTPQVIMGS